MKVENRNSKIFPLALALLEKIKREEAKKWKQLNKVAWR